MNDQQRTHLFLVCLLVRTGVAYGAKKTARKHLPKLALLALIPAIGFTYNYFNKAATVGTFGGRAWWQPMRLVHAALCLAFAVLAWKKHPEAWRILALDAVLGVISFATFKRHP